MEPRKKASICQPSTRAVTTNTHARRRDQAPITSEPLMITRITTTNRTNRSTPSKTNCELTADAFATSKAFNPAYPSTTPLSYGVLAQFRLIWLHSMTIKSTKDYEHAIGKLRSVIDTLDIFTNVAKCTEFLQTKTDELRFVIITNDFAQETIPLIHDLPDIQCIFILGDSQSSSKAWMKNWDKLDQDSFVSIDSICQVLEQEIQQYHVDRPTIHVTHVESIRTDTSFMCSRLLREIFMDLKVDRTAKKEFIEFYRQNPRVDRAIIDELEGGYSSHTPVWWYTQDRYLSRAIHRAFQSLDLNSIVKMRFFVQDLQQQIKDMYSPPCEKLKLYRGQACTQLQLEQLRMGNGDLFSFNNFLSTTTDEQLARSHATTFDPDSEEAGVVFCISVHPESDTATPWISLDPENAGSGREGEFLFAMHTVFRLGETRQLDDRLWQIELSPIGDDHEDLKEITECIRQRIKGSAGWDGLGRFFLTIGEFERAEQIFELLIQGSPKTDCKGLGYRYHQMGLLKTHTSLPKKAIIYFNKAIKMYTSCTNPKRSDVTSVQSDIGSLYQFTGEYDKALKSYYTALHMEEASQPINYSNLAIIYGYIADTYQSMKQYATATQIYRNVLKIRKRCIPPNFLTLSKTYKTLAEIHASAEEYPQALDAFRRVRHIQQTYLSACDFDVAEIESKIGQVYGRMGEQAKASEHYQNALRYCQTPLDTSWAFRTGKFADLADIYTKIGVIYNNMNDSDKAIEYSKKAVEVLTKAPNVNQPALAAAHHHLGQVHERLFEFKHALFAYKKALDIACQSPYPNTSQVELYQTHYRRALHSFHGL